MARPAKAVGSNSKHMTRSEKTARQTTEEILKGKSNLKPAPFLTKTQKKIFRYIVNELEEANILGALDVDILNLAAVTIDRIRIIDEIINLKPEYLLDKETTTIRSGYIKEFFRICNELCLSPQSRAKMSISASKMAEEKGDDLLKTLGIGNTIEVID